MRVLLVFRFYLPFNLNTNVWFSLVRHTIYLVQTKRLLLPTIIGQPLVRAEVCKTACEDFVVCAVYSTILQWRMTHFYHRGNSLWGGGNYRETERCLWTLVSHVSQWKQTQSPEQWKSPGSCLGIDGLFCHTCISYSAVAEILLGPYCASTVLLRK